MEKKEKFELKEVIDLPTYDDKITEMKSFISSKRSKVANANELWETLKNSMQTVITNVIGNDAEVESIESNTIFLNIQKTIKMIITFNDEISDLAKPIIQISGVDRWSDGIILTAENYDLIGKLYNIAPEIVQSVEKSKKRLDKVSSKKKKYKLKLMLILIKKLQNIMKILSILFGSNLLTVMVKKNLSF